MKKKFLLMMMILIGSAVSVSTTSQAAASTSTTSTYFVKDGYHIEVLHYSGVISSIEVTMFGPRTPGYHFNMWPGYYLSYNASTDDWCFTGKINVEDPNLGWVTLDIVCND